MKLLSLDNRLFKQLVLFIDRCKVGVSTQADEVPDLLFGII